MITFTTQLTSEQKSLRSRLLQESMREDDLYPIEREFPIVFSNPENSITGLHGAIPVSHANFLYRNLVSTSGQTWKVALIGNVATLQSFRGQGLQRQLFNYLEQQALKERVDALILWSDLILFYQKLGFREFGTEIRFQWSKKATGDLGFLKLSATTAQSISENDIENLLRLRPTEFPTLSRSISEFKMLLTIPETTLIRGFDENHELRAWAISGKGCDMRGVAHEWGAKNPRDLDRFFSSLCSTLDVSDMMVLAPGHLNQQFLKILEKGSSHSSQHPMAMIRQLSTQSIPEDTFIWGLDSI